MWRGASTLCGMRDADIAPSSLRGQPLPFAGLRAVGFRGFAGPLARGFPASAFVTPPRAFRAPPRPFNFAPAPFAFFPAPAQSSNAVRTLRQARSASIARSNRACRMLKDGMTAHLQPSSRLPHQASDPSDSCPRHPQTGPHLPTQAKAECDHDRNCRAADHSSEQRLQ